MTKEQIEKLSFEEALTRLEETVRLLESGNVPLDDCLALFEEGIALVKMCNEKLEAAEQKIKILTKAEDGTLTETEFKPADIKG
jgi:exodeoxyribonuclease VII small subunit